MRFVLCGQRDNYHLLTNLSGIEVWQGLIQHFHIVNLLIRAGKIYVLKRDPLGPACMYEGSSQRASLQQQNIGDFTW